MTSPRHLSSSVARLIDQLCETFLSLTERVVFLIYDRVSNTMTNETRKDFSQWGQEGWKAIHLRKLYLSYMSWHSGPMLASCQCPQPATFSSSQVQLGQLCNRDESLSHHFPKRRSHVINGCGCTKVCNGHYNRSVAALCTRCRDCSTNSITFTALFLFEQYALACTYCWFMTAILTSNM